MRGAEAFLRRGGELAALNSTRVLTRTEGGKLWSVNWVTQRGVRGMKRATYVQGMVVPRQFAVAHLGALVELRQRGETGGRTRPMSTVKDGAADSFLPVEERVKFGEPDAERQTLTKAVAKRKYLLRDTDVNNNPMLRPFRGAEHVTPERQGDSEVSHQGPVVFLIQDIERACMRRWGSEKEFRREQLRYEIRRRRQVTRPYTDSPRKCARIACERRVNTLAELQG